MKNYGLSFTFFSVAISGFLSITSQSILNKSISEPQEICRVELLRNDVVIQEILEPIRPEQLSTDDRRVLRVYQRQLRQYEHRLERFEDRIERFKEQVECSQQGRKGKVRMVFSDNCEEFQDENISGGDNYLPSLDTLVENSELHQFITNPNMKSEGNGVYAINFTDPNYIEGESYITISREERLDSEAGAFIIRVDFQERTATLIDNEELIDLSEEYFDDSFVDP